MNFLFMAIALGTQAAPAGGEPPPQEAKSSEIIVQGTRRSLEEELRTLLDTETDQIARFEMEFCPLVLGYDAEYTRVIVNRLKSNARLAGLQLGKEGCRPNALVVFIERPHDLMQAFRMRMPQVYRGMSARDVSVLTKREKPFYVWHGIGRVGRYGERIFETVSTTFMASRLRRLQTFDIQVAYLIVDISQTVGMTLGQIGDFASLQLLLDLRLAAEDRTRPGSLLKLFDYANPQDAPSAMTRFDKALLQGVYAPGRTDRLAFQQRSLIAQAMIDAEAEDQLKAEAPD